MKPTFNAISIEGQKTFAPTFDTIGFFARSIEDLQLLANVFNLTDDEPPRDLPLSDVSVAVMTTPMWQFAGPGTVDAMEKASAILQNSGARLENVRFPPELDNAKLLNRIQNVITNGEAQRFLALYELAKNYSVILTPSAVDEAPLGLDDMGKATFNTMWTGFHMPVINIPAFTGDNGMPVCVSLVAPRYQDEHLLKISKILSALLMTTDDRDQKL